MIDKNWRPDNWKEIKEEIIENTPIVFSLSSGYEGNQKNDLMEKAASAILEASGGQATKSG